MFVCVCIGVCVCAPVFISFLNSSQYKLNTSIHAWELNTYIYIYNCSILFYNILYIYSTLYITGGSWNGGTPKSSIFNRIFHVFGIPELDENIWKPHFRVSSRLVESGLIQVAVIPRWKRLEKKITIKLVGIYFSIYLGMTIKVSINGKIWKIIYKPGDCQLPRLITEGHLAFHGSASQFSLGRQPCQVVKPCKWITGL